MVRKSAKSTTPFVALTSDDVGSIVMASAGNIKDKKVDPRKIVGTIHIKKYLADVKINGKVETWISVIKKLSAVLPPGETREDLTAEEAEALEECKRMTRTYLEEEASGALRTKVDESGDELKSLKDVSSSMKFKFSRFAYEAVTHVVNLMVREILVYTCGQCASQKAKLTKVAHIPWGVLQNKLLAGLYMNTKAVYLQVHPSSEPEEAPVATEAAADAEEPTDDAVEGASDASGPVKAVKPRLSQFISNTFKEIVSRDERVHGLLLGKEVTAVINDIIYQVLDRFTNVIKSLLQTANSKTVNERLALIATKILLQDHVLSVDADVAVVLDVMQARLDELKDIPESEGDDNEDVPHESP
jgi:hypothetical protein